MKLLDPAPRKLASQGSLGALADQNSTAADGPLDAQLCQVVGVNQNYTSTSGTLYHVQIEDRGPLLDRVTERSVRRLNVVIYANYGEANARIVHGRDHDLPDLRTHAHNALVSQQIQELAGRRGRSSRRRSSARCCGSSA